MTKNQWIKFCNKNDCPSCEERFFYPAIVGVRIGKQVENICRKCYDEKWSRFPDKTKTKIGGFFNHLDKDGTMKCK